MSQQRLSPEERKRQILEVATAVFAQKGFHGASIEDITESAGISKGGLYWHFNSKEDIIIALLQQFFDQEMVGVEQVVSAEGSALGRLRQMIGFIGAEMASLGPLLPISLEFYTMAVRQEKIRDWINDYYDRYRILLAELLEQGIARGEIARIDPQEAAHSLIALFEGSLLLWLLSPEQENLQSRLENGLQLFIDGLRNNERASSGGK